MVLALFLPIWIGFTSLIFATDASSLKTEERLYELEAQLETLKSELSSTTAIARQKRINEFNPAITVVADFLGQYGFNVESHDDHEGDHKDHNHSAFENGFFVKEIELELMAPVDPFADALVAVAIHPHGHHAKIHLEEAYARLKQWPGLGFAPLGLIIKAGLFKTSLGRINRLHRHNISQMDYPLATKAFLGDEGHSAAGLSLNTSFNVTDKSAINLFVEGVFNSRLHSQLKGAEKIPSGIFHGWFHQELSSTHFLDIGVSTLIGRKGQANSGVFSLLSGDIHYSYLPEGYGPNPFFLVGNEFYTANVPKKISRWPIGNFTWAQIRLFNSTFFGVKYDLAPTVKNFDELEHSLGAYISHYTTEFLRFRLGYEHVMPKIQSLDGDHRLMLSMTLVMGSHPVEPYFANR